MNLPSLLALGCAALLAGCGDAPRIDVTDAKQVGVGAGRFSG